jgi:cysteinyl-tRNA synthetase
MLHLYNSLTRKKEEFKPLNPPKVGLYTCGPTVYGPGHLGHARTYTTFDILKRVLRLNNFDVKHVLNITDVHDDMIKEAARRGISILELADEYIPLFQRDLKDLNITPADFYPRVTEVIPEIIEMVKTLVDKGYAYVSDDGPAGRRAGSVYFSVAKFSAYGRLSGIKLEKGVTGTRVKTDKYERDHPSDFALWKAAKDAVEEQTGAVWDSPWGKGRPGWHIECSVMAKKFLGNSIDIHAGAMDLKFPHHENEIAQSEAANGVPFARFWVHAGLLDIEGQKMSKSLGNVYSLADLRRRGFEPLDFRYLTLTAHYRSRLNFTWEGLKAARNALRRLRREIRSLKIEAGTEARSVRLEKSSFQSPVSSRASSVTSPASGIGCSDYEQRFLEAVNDDLDLPRALALLWELVKSDKFPSSAKHQTILKFDEVLGLGLSGVGPSKVPSGVQKLVNERESLRQKGDFTAADKLRRQIEEQGFTVEDTPQGPHVKRL